MEPTSRVISHQALRARSISFLRLRGATMSKFDLYRQSASECLALAKRATHDPSVGTAIVGVSQLSKCRAQTGAMAGRTDNAVVIASIFGICPSASHLRPMLPRQRANIEA